MYTMYRFLVILAVVHSTLAVTEPTLEDFINQIFGVDEGAADVDDNVERPKDCVAVVGKGAQNTCYECRFCNDSITNKRYSINPVKVVLKNNKCTGDVEVCCENPANWLNLRANDISCGTPSPDGNPRRRRQFPRSMLQGEFPWRAWVYSKSSDKPLCAATFIHENKKALIALASCVRARAADTLEVSFIRNEARIAVSDVIMHEDYSPDDDRNNIAILQVVSLDLPSPTWSFPACLPQGAPPQVTACVTTTEADLRIESVIPVRSACTADNSTLPESLTCALTAPGDYEPEDGAGLYCSLVSPPKYTVYGLFTSVEKNIGSYVDVWHFMPWLKMKLHLKD